MASPVSLTCCENKALAQINAMKCFSSDVISNEFSLTFSYNFIIEKNNPT